VSDVISCLKPAAIVAVVMTAIGLFGSCETEPNRIIRTGSGRVITAERKIVSGAQITVVDAEGETVFETKTKEDGTFRLLVKPGRYRVRVESGKYQPFAYIVDLRAAELEKAFDVFLQGGGACRDVRLPDEPNDVCASEVIKPNLLLKSETTISGVVKDETGAPFKNSLVSLMALSAIELQPAYLDVKTDDFGRFVFEPAEPGEYRLRASPHRGFAQPEKLECWGQKECNLDITLKVNPTDLDYAACPIM
jgi:Carboxypeptidase regulatory-like domain